MQYASQKYDQSLILIYFNVDHLFIFDLFRFSPLLADFLFVVLNFSIYPFLIIILKLKMFGKECQKDPLLLDCVYRHVSA